MVVTLGEPTVIPIREEVTILIVSAIVSLRATSTSGTEPPVPSGAMRKKPVAVRSSASAEDKLDGDEVSISSPANCSWIN